MLVHLVSRQQRLKRQLADAKRHMLMRTVRSLAAQRQHVLYARRTLRQLDPKVVLARGYAIVRDKSGTLVHADASLSPGDAVVIETSNAIINAGVTNVQPKK